MNRIHRCMSIVTVAAILTGICGAASAEPENASSPRAAWRRSALGDLIRADLGRLVTLKAELGVTDAQRSQIREIVLSHRDELKPVVRNMVEQRRRLREAVLADDINEAAIRDASATLAEPIGNMAVLAAGIAAEIRDVLTEAQKEKLRAFGESHRASMDAWLEQDQPGE